MNLKKKKDPYLPPDDALWFLPLGGSGEIGMNLNLYGTAGKWLMVDCGIMFGDETTPGIDIITPDISFIAERSADLLGIVITHAHEDHLGAIEHLWPQLRCPIYAAPFAAAMIRAKLAQAGLQNQVCVNEIPNGGSCELGPFAVEFVRVTHSVPDSHMLAINTVHGRVIHTGDWKLDDEPVVGYLTDEQRFRELGHDGVMAVVGDSTGALVTTPVPSEIDAQRGLKKLFNGRKGRIAVTCFASNIARLRSIAAAARENGRYVSLVGRSLWRNAEMAAELGYFPEFNGFLSEHEAMQSPRDKIVMVCTGCQGEKRAALSRIAAFDHPVAELERGDVVFFSSRDIPGNEKAIARVQNLLISQGIDVVTADHVPQGTLLHASGHAGQPEMKIFYEWVKPRLIVPVHGEVRHQVEHERLAHNLGFTRTMISKNGKLMRLGPGVYEEIAEVPVGRWGLDGINLRPLDETVAKDRRKMNFNGAAVVTLVLDRRGIAVCDPQVTLLGVDDEHTIASLREELSNHILDELERMPRSILLSDKGLKEAVFKVIRRRLRETQGKKPVVEVHLIRV
ncbi:MAG: ribonuclease J [Proteobacteria bacterium]|jgi:ribonuclease J|nr:ribonuclease J [Alphaproteobacteria bacterium]NCC02908.1 ribonuclease J [Pseudomonadota bacterium]